MKSSQNTKDHEKPDWDPMKPPTRIPKLMGYLGFFVIFTYIVYTLKIISSPSRACENDPIRRHSLALVPNATTTRHESDPIVNTDINNNMNISLDDIVFGIAGSANLWEKRKNYIKLWWKKPEMRGAVWLDRPVTTRPGENLPTVKVSASVDKFTYTNKQGLKNAIRITRVVSETYRVGFKNVKWFVMGDDDTFFIPDNLLRVLSKYDHNEYYYIGSTSESHLQNIWFSYNMAFGGGGFAISYPLAKALERMQDRCVQRYPGLFASDDRVQACMAELGVPLTREVGFHQYDVVGNLFGLLAAHPVVPLVSMHHLDVVEPIFPNSTRLESLQRLTVPMKLDSAALIQQSICYDRQKKWTVSVSWGYAVQVFRGILSPREIEMPSRTFLNWYLKTDYTSYSFNTRPVSVNPCQKPFVFYYSKGRVISSTNQTLSEYTRHRVPHPGCSWQMVNPRHLEKVQVFKKLDPHMWNRSPRRNCCRIMKTKRRSNMVVDVGVCRDGEISALYF